ncbi:hypothetical protein ACIP4W_13490 [Streptomyces sp. NPDC088846]
MAAVLHGHRAGGGRFAAHFDEIVFAILDRTRERNILRAFELSWKE